MGYGGGGGGQGSGGGFGMGVGMGTGATGLGDDDDSDVDENGLSKRRRIQAGGSDNGIIEAGRRVAGRTPKGEWMLMTVLAFNRRSKTYRLEDADEEDEQKQAFNLPARDVIPLPTKDNASQAAFPPGTRVLAVWPDTTAFYPAQVLRVHRRPANKFGRPQLPDYVLHFDEDEEANGEPAQKRVKGEFVVLEP